MKVLIACESSGIIRDEFLKRGHDAISCDLLPTERKGPHYQGNIFDIINNGFDLMIGHPPCTYLSFAAKAYWNTNGRAQKRIDALQFFLNLWNAPIDKICLENPLGIIDAVIEKHSQIVHPYYFGGEHQKRTCLWLKNLPLLIFTKQNDLFSIASASEKPEPIYIDKKTGKKRYFIDSIGGAHGEGNSFKKRSVSFKEIGAAMAEQWGNL